MLSVWLLLLTTAIRCPIVSKSSIQTCEASDNSTDCKAIIYVQVDLQNGQAFNERMDFNISKMSNQEGKEIKLDRPLTVSLQKSPIEVAYKALYIQDVNYYPQEQVIASSYMSCTEGVYIGSTTLASSTCTIKRDDSGKVIGNSQGYCCSCSLVTLATGVKSGSTRADCGFLSNSMTAFCLNFPNIWFSLYEVPNYQFNYIITLKMSATLQNGTTQDKDFYLSNSIKRVNNGIFSAEILGEYAPTSPPPTFSDKYLLKPHIPVDEASPTDNWLLVPKDMVSLDGSTCNKIGVSYTAFQNQANKCQQARASCLSNQIKNILDSENIRASQDLQPQYRLKRYGSFGSSKAANGGLSLNLNYKEDMATSMLIKIDATDLIFTVNVGKGLINSFLIVDFEGMTTFGSLNITVESLSTLSASYELSLNCTKEINPMPSKTISLGSKETKNVSFDIYTSTHLRDNHTCIATLLTSTGAVLDNETITFSTTATNFTTPQFESTEYNPALQTQEPIAEMGCEELCGNRASVFCQLMNGCSMFTRNLFVFAGLIILLFLMTCCCSLCFCGYKKTLKAVEKSAKCIVKWVCCAWICMRKDKTADDDEEDSPKITKKVKKSKKSSKKVRFKQNDVSDEEPPGKMVKPKPSKQVPVKSSLKSKVQVCDDKSDANLIADMSKQDESVASICDEQMDEEPDNLKNQNSLIYMPVYINFISKRICGKVLTSRCHCQAVMIIDPYAQVKYKLDKKLLDILEYESEDLMRGEIYHLVQTNDAVITFKKPLYQQLLTNSLVKF